LVSPHADTCGHFCIRTSCRRQTQAPRLSVRTSEVLPEHRRGFLIWPRSILNPSADYS